MAHFEENSSDTDSNERHWYFTTLMEEVILTLQPRFQSDLSSESPRTDGAFEALENRFAALEVEEPLEDNAESVDSGTKASQPVYELERPADDQVAKEEETFAVICMLEDLRQLRDFVFRLWVDYKNGIVDLIIASVTTNAAFQ